MSEIYVPTVEEVRTDYVLAYADRDSSQLQAGAAFDHFIAKMEADAWDEGYEAGARDVGGGLRDYELTPNPHRIENGASNE